MKKQRISGEEESFLWSSNDYEDDDCAVCRLMRKVEREKRDPTTDEVMRAMRQESVNKRT
jgi:hypothetical protein